jgi:hypothetical protein
MIRKNLRVVILTALFLLSLQAVAAKKNSTNLETYKDQISKSQVLLLQQDRLQATQLLISAINQEGTKSASYLELSKALKKAAELFFSEKAQQSYEMAMASYPTDKGQALVRMREILNLEPMNTLVIKGLIFTLLNQNECGLAAKQRVDLAKINPLDEDLTKLAFLELVCKKGHSDALAYFGKLDTQVAQQPFWLINKHRVIGSLIMPTSLDWGPPWNDYPEMVYLSWFYEKNANKRIVLAEKYKNLCQLGLAFDKAYSWMDPWVCDRVKEME